MKSESGIEGSLRWWHLLWEEKIYIVNIRTFAIHFVKEQAPLAECCEAGQVRPGPAMEVPVHHMLKLSGSEGIRALTAGGGTSRPRSHSLTTNQTKRRQKRGWTNGKKNHPRPTYL